MRLSNYLASCMRNYRIRDNPFRANFTYLARWANLAYLAIRSDDQLENRFEPMMLPVWEANDDCCSLLASFAASLPLRRPSPIATLDMARYLLTRSEGTIGELAHLLMAAAIVAVESGEEAINHRTLSMAVYTGPSERRRQFERELM